VSPSDTRLPKDETPVLNDENSLKLGIFATNLRGGACLADIEGNIYDEIKLERTIEGMVAGFFAVPCSAHPSR
jgi:hypothetical protein